MEIIIGLLVVAAVAFYLVRKNKEVEAELQAKEAPYKVEQPVFVEPVRESESVSTPVNPQVTDSVTVTLPVVEEKQWPMTEATPKARAKKPSAPKAAPAKPKSAPAIKAAPVKKPRAPRAK